MDDTEPTPPGWLDDDAVAEWHRLLSDRRVAGLDPIAVAACCQTRSWWRRVREVVEQVEADGAATWTDAGGDTHRHPAFQTEAFLAHQLHELTSALGIETAGRPARRPTRILFLDEGDTLHES